MFSQLTNPVATAKKKAPQPSAQPGVHELLKALADVRARKAELEREERDLVAATRARLREQEQELEDLKRRVQDTCTEVAADGTPLVVAEPWSPTTPAAEVLS